SVGERFRLLHESARRTQRTSKITRTVFITIPTLPAARAARLRSSDAASKGKPLSTATWMRQPGHSPTNNQEPATSNQQPVTNNQEPPTDFRLVSRSCSAYQWRMRPVPLLALAFLGIGMSCHPAPAADLPGWELVWSDEFTGPSLDLTKWEFEVNADGGGNKELQYYVTNNVRVKDGMLQIEAR